MNSKASSSRLSAHGAMAIVIIVVVVSGAYFSIPSIRKVMAGRNATANSAVHPSEPWTNAQIVQPAELAKEIADAKGANKPVVVCSGFKFLYDGAHVPGAIFHGPASKAEGLDDLKKWAQGIPRSSNLVVYCGCCPFEQCPNIRPAFEALRSTGFQHLRVLVLPNNFAKDWVGQGYPVEKGR